MTWVRLQRVVARRRGEYAPLNDGLTAEQAAARGLPVEWPDEPSLDDEAPVELPRDVAVEVAMALLLYGYGFTPEDDGTVVATEDVLRDGGAAARRAVDLLPPEIHGEAFIRGT